MAVLAITVLLSAMTLGGGLILSRTAPAPTLISSTPADGLSDVATRIQPTLHFSQPMNPRTVERALRFEPAITARLVWNSDYTNLTIIPLENLQPETQYQIILDSQARSRQLVTLKQEYRQSFQTAPAPAVLAVLPAAESTDVAVTAPLLLQFSRPMISQATPGQTRPFPALTLTPPTPGQVTWLTPSVALFRPDAPLLAATRYTVRLDANLSDTQGETLGRDNTWSFTTSLPRVLSFSPTDASRFISSTAPLTVTLSQAIPQPDLSRMLSISPSVEGSITSALLPNASQLITFTPKIGWQRGTSYVATFAGGLNRPDVIGARWRFETAPAPALIGRYPGEGQTLPTGQDIRLIFSTPINTESLQSALIFDPPAESFNVTSLGSEARVHAILRAATAYTLTLPARLTDMAGTALGREYLIHFRTPPALPELKLLQLDKHIVQFTPDQPANLKLSLTNMSAVLVNIYDLDEATLVRTASFDENEWGLFQPERYNLPLRRAWTQPLSMTLNTATEYDLQITDADDKPLPAGAYYLRLRSPDGPRADLIVLISSTRLALQLGPRTGLVWATDILSGSVRAAAPLAIYQDDALVLESNTNDQGLLTFMPVGGAPHRYTILARGGQPAVIRSESLTLALQSRRGSYRAALLTDADSYAAGDSIQLYGFVRQAITETLRYAPDGTPVTLRLTNGHDLQTPVPGSSTLATQLRANAILSTSFKLDQNLLPGSYALSADIAGQLFSLPIHVHPASDPDLQLHVELPARLNNPATLPAQIRLTNATGLPRPGLPISWTLSIESALPFLPVGFADSLPTPTNSVILTGTALTDSDGRVLLTIDLPDTAPTLRRYRLRAEAQTSQGVSSHEARMLPFNSASYVAIRAQHQLLTANEQLRLDFLSIDQWGNAQAGTTLNVQIVRLIGEREQAVVRRTLTADRQGAAQLVIRLSEGRYQVRAWPQASGRPVISSSDVQIVADGSVSATNSAAIQLSRQDYQIGDTLRLLPTRSDSRLLTLTTIAGLSGTSANVRELRPGEFITHTLTRADTPQINVHVLGLDPGQRTGAWLFDQPIRVHNPTEVLSVTVAAPQHSFLPGSTARLTVTTRTNAGKPVSSDLIIALVDAAEDQLPLSHYSAAQQQAIRSYLQPNTLISQPAQPPSAAVRPTSLVWQTGLQTDAQGRAIINLPLTANLPNLRVIVWAASPEAIGQTTTQISLERKNMLRLDLPAFVRPGDELLLTAQSASIDLSQPFSVTLQAEPAVIQTVALSQTVAANQPASWNISVQPGKELGLKLIPGTSSQSSPILSATRPILGDGLDTAQQQSEQQGQVFILRSYLDPDTGKPLDASALKAGQSIHIRLTIATLATLEGVSIYEPLAAGLSSSNTNPTSPLRLLTEAPDHIELMVEKLQPGIYEYSYEQRASFPGVYTQPATSLSTKLKPLQVENDANQLRIMK